MRKVITRLSAAAVVSLAAVALAAPGSASAATFHQVCTGSGTLHTTQVGPNRADWSVAGQGQCAAPREPRTVTFTGAGSSQSLGLCSPGHLLVQNLKLRVKVTYTGANTGHVINETQIWGSPVTTFPLATPYFVSSGGVGLRGAGLVMHHIYLNCGNDGNMPSAAFAWAALR